MRNWKFQNGFSLVELLVVTAIISILSSAAYLGVAAIRSRSYNDKMLGDISASANILEQYAADHDGKFPVPLPAPGQNRNLLCYDSNAVYTHDCLAASFIQGRIDNTLLGTRYLSEVPMDPWTGSRFAYGVTPDGKYFQIAGLWKESDGSFSVRTSDNLFKGFALPSLIRAFDGPNFVVQRGNYLPYPSDAKELSVTFTGLQGVTVNGTQVAPGEPVIVFQNDTIA
ncbi:type II secretion system protein, partial [Candidatus Peregrinibacteria bacterium]|nr:type II secretion system protein [Candidatus Peregrinibacteria bacterium]